MRLFVALFVLLGILAESAPAQVRNFPYEALIDADSVLVHSGPGQQYYATSRLNQGDHVVVHRHDPGGWYMIAPPAGSFSWIRADAVNRLSGRRGVVNAGNVAVRVGSAFEDTRDVFQVRLSTGAAVDVIGEQTIQTERGAVRMLKIAPPKGEWRWIPGRAVTPVDQIVRGQLDRDPYAVPSHARRQREHSFVGVSGKRAYEGGPRLSEQKADDEKQRADRPVVGSFDGESTRQRGPTSEEVRRDRLRLKELDEQFRAIIEVDTSQWDFAHLKQEYLDLQKTASHPAITSQVDLRLTSIQRYETIKADYDGFIQLTSETSRRDANLLALQQAQLRSVDVGGPVGPARQAVPSVRQPISPMRRPAPRMRQWRVRPPANATLTVQPSPAMKVVAPPRPAAGPALVAPNRALTTPPATPTPATPPQPNTFLYPKPVAQPSPAGRTNAVPVQAVPPQGVPVNFPTTAPQPARMQRSPRVKGAGIIQRTVGADPRAPQHVLLAPNGRILAYLQAGPGVNLDQHLGQAMGVDGDRVHRPDLQMDVFLVHSLMPVRLQP